VFSSNNWNCLTANALRDLVRQDEDDSRAVWSEDQYAALLPWDGAFIVLSWYKHRGRTEGMWLVQEGEIAILTLEQAEAYLDARSPEEREKGRTR
jgi:hypothetical protein